MYKTSLRAQRVANNMHKQLAKLFRHDITDPRLCHVQISYIDVSADLRNAKVFFCLSDNVKLTDDVVSALSKASHFLRKKVAAALVLRVTPKIHFEFDSVLDRAHHLNTLLHSVNSTTAFDGGDVSELSAAADID
jgi:ribosome-binding factor A